MLVAAIDLLPGDLVKVTNGPFCWAKVTRKRDTTVMVVRPWMSGMADTTGDNSYPYVGLEVFDLQRTEQAYEVIRDVVRGE
jgi:hypothetical protein